MNDMTHDSEALGAAEPADVNGGVNISQPQDHYAFLADIKVRLSVEVGSVSMTVSDIMDLREGSVVELDRQVDQLIDINVNGTLVARGEVVPVKNKFGVRIAEIVSNGMARARVERRT
ncbi:flagellar motor switch protein FliN [Sphingorhabdus sp. EL138]|uniref:flagellar motor switch protein FliN n=1 Tax=Sphingorhabdus sp. EL138 TaxID=2073156 RepID=UPI000D6997DC|nr:flagellar motor switch protein FliN [Sphingorhabdus sp. EL138]